MKPTSILLITQTLDRNDHVLGFFHRWVEEFAKHFSRVTVICLQKGEVALPENVRVFSLGKEEGKGSRWMYAFRFFRTLWSSGLAYETVFVHMNEEYVLLTGWWWRFMGKKVLLWRNHPSGSWKTRVAVRLAHTVFCTSHQSYTAQFKKALVMPVGIVLPEEGKVSVPRIPNSFLSLGRISPVKQVDFMIRSFAQAHLPPEAVFAVVGDPVARAIDIAYEQTAQLEVTQAIAKGKRVERFPGVPAHQTASWFEKYEVFLNATEPGSFDKTILEAAAQGCIPLVAQNIWKNTDQDGLGEQLTFTYRDEASCTQAIERLAALSESERQGLRVQLRAFIQKYHSLERLFAELLLHV